MIRFYKQKGNSSTLNPSNIYIIYVQTNLNTLLLTSMGHAKFLNLNFDIAVCLKGDN